MNHLPVCQQSSSSAYLVHLIALKQPLFILQYVGFNKYVPLHLENQQYSM